MDKLKYFLKGLIVSALLFFAFYLGRRRSLKKALEKRKELLKERLKNVDEAIKEMEELKNSYAYGALGVGEKERLDEAYKSRRKERERTLNKINKDPDPEKNEEIFNAIKDIFSP